LEIGNTKFQTNRMIEIQKSKKYDLEDRTFEFASEVRLFVKNLSKIMANI
jgi:hypothetical protein